MGDWKIKTNGFPEKKEDIEEEEDRELEQESSIKLQEKIIEPFPSENPNPVLRVEKDGKVLFANRAACFLLEHWGIKEGGELPQALKHGIRRAFSQKTPEKLEIRIGETTYALMLYPRPEIELIDIYGFDISFRVRAEEKLRSWHERLENLVELRTLEYIEANDKLAWEITERKGIEKTLRNNLQFLETLLDSIPSPVFQMDRNDIYVNCNESFARQIMGLPKKLVIGGSFSEFQKKIPKELAEIYYKHDRELLDSRGSRYYETRVNCADGVSRDFLFHKATYENSLGEVAGVVGVMLDITPCKEAEKFFRKGEKRYRITAKQTGQIVYDYDVESGKIGWAGSIQQLTGYSSEEFSQVDLEGWIAHVHPEDRERVWESHEKCMENGEKCLEEYGFRKKDGSYICVEDVGIYLKVGDKRVCRVLGVIKDITEKRSSRGKLQESEERFRITTEQTGQIVFEHDHGDNMIRWAGAVQDVTGYTAEEFSKFDYAMWTNHIHPRDRERVLGELRIFHMTDTKFRVEYRFRKKDGTYIHVEDSGVYQRNEEGSIRRSLGVIKDITGIKLASEKLKESEARYRSFMKNFRGIAFQMGIDFTLILIDGNTEETTGYCREEFFSGKVNWYQLVHPADRYRVFENRGRLKKDPLLLIGHEYRIRHRDGNIRWVREIIQNVSDPSDKKRILQGTIYDISKQKEAEESLAKVEEIRKKEIHHRIKNNLQVISSLLELQAEKFDDPEVLEAFRESQNRVATMAIIHEELYRSRNNETLDFSAYLQKLTADLFNSYIVRKGDVGMQLNIEEIFLGMDTAVPLGIIINELVSNSLKHAFPSGRKGEVCISLCRTEENNENKSISNIINNMDSKSPVDKNIQHILVVSDNGLGFPENVDFRNTNSLGLQLVNILVEQLEGTIELENDSGTKFKIWFKEPCQSSERVSSAKGEI